MRDGAGGTDLWQGLAPGFAWRPSQRRLLDSVAAVPAAKRHIVAPPGAGKTLIGLELARRVGARTVVLAPTVAIRDQWRRSTALFGADVESFTGDDPSAGRPLTCVTYQLLGDPGQAGAALTAAARRLWLARVESSTSADVAAARVEALEKHDPDRARREINREVRRLRRSLATGEDVGLPYADLLGARATELLDLLAVQGVGCLVLDECHHLLDWWSLVVAALVTRLREAGGVALVGLTATPPDPSSETEERNYRGLLGDVDAELHLPAVVSERGVSPWRDGVHLTTLTETESDFLDGWGRELAGELDGCLTGDPFIGWAVGRLLTAALDDRAARVGALPASGPGPERLMAAPAVASGDGSSTGVATSAGLSATGTVTAPSGLPAAVDAAAVDAAGWSEFWDRDPLLGAALLRWWTARGLSLPEGFDPPPGAAGDLSIDDRLALIDAWLHDPAGTCDAEMREGIDRCGARHGISFTSSGPRWGRSVADIVCARSAAKGRAAAEIVAAEAARRGEGMRALVAVELDAAAAPPAEARRVLGEDPGTAAQITAALCADHRVVGLGVVTVTGRGMWADALGAERYCAAVNTGSAPPQRWVSAEGCDIPGAVRIVGHGPGWTAARWLEAAADALEEGGARVLVATRGLVGEGWDHPPINVLVDLTEGTSPAAATQLRGRALRVNPAEPGKVSSLWDVAVVHPAAPGDWERLRRRHGRWWGPDGNGRVVTGPAKLHPRLGERSVPSADEMAVVNEVSAAAVADVERTLRAWADVPPDGIGTSVVHVRRGRVRRQVRTGTAARQSRDRFRDRFGRRVVVGGGVAATGMVAGLGGAVLYRPLLGLAAAGLLAGAGVAAGGRASGGDEDRRRLQALGRGVAAGLQATGTAGMAQARIVVDVDAGGYTSSGGGSGSDPAGGLAARIEGTDDRAATVWADSLAEMLGPVGTPRWILQAGDQAWRVPAAVGATREAAEAFTAGFARHVRGAVLIRAGTPEATAVVLADAGRRPEPVGRSLRWAR